MSLLTDIQAAFPNLTPQNRDDGVIATTLSLGRTKVAPREIGIGTILATLGPAGGDFLDGLVALGATDRSLFWAMELIKAGTLDVGLPATREQMTAFSANVPSVAPAVLAILALAVYPDPVTPQQVAQALEGL